ncbi:hypothetical protein ebA3554 [Aromatoleum aromaticum EbN1]|uniref:Uncharacterized protein n=1 Tax=Aromatoleum aromaticum (strain DSM 19018 / LMG 30748 / EbN1) TaxID=76114 RepID=Q5P3I3_AROAE|nr:hypothetical protein ebA3554 [Aromatoleum aromaticum EbN1]
MSGDPRGPAAAALRAASRAIGELRSPRCMYDVQRRFPRRAGERCINSAKMRNFCSSTSDLIHNNQPEQQKVLHVAGTQSGVGRL